MDPTLIAFVAGFAAMLLFAFAGLKLGDVLADLMGAPAP